MKDDWLELVACPACRNSLRIENGAISSLVCLGCGVRYAFRDQIPVLVPEGDLENLEDFSKSYTNTRLNEGWRPISEEKALKLPFAQPEGYPRIYWQVRQQSYRALTDLLGDQRLTPSKGPIVELGAGNGWLSYHLAKLGYQVVALDANLEETFGLGAAKVYLPHTEFTLVQGDLNRPPLPDHKFGLVIFNASLHYAADLISALLSAKRALLPEGRIVIMDSPISKWPYLLGSGIGGRRLERHELDDSLAAAGLRAQWIPVKRGVRWWVFQAARQFKGGEPISFPLIVAERTPLEM